MVQKSLCQVQDPQQLSKLFSSVWHSARHFTAATAKIKGSMAGIAKKEWMVTTTPIQPHTKMCLGFESDAFGIRMWKCVLSWFLPVSVCLLQVIPLLGGPNQKTLPKRILAWSCKVERIKSWEIQDCRSQSGWTSSITNLQVASKLYMWTKMKHTKHTNCHLGGKAGSKLTQAGFVAEKCTSAATAFCKSVLQWNWNKSITWLWAKRKTAKPKKSNKERQRQTKWHRQKRTVSKRTRLLLQRQWKPNKDGT